VLLPPAIAIAAAAIAAITTAAAAKTMTTSLERHWYDPIRKFFDHNPHDCCLLATITTVVCRVFFLWQIFETVMKVYPVMELFGKDQTFCQRHRLIGTVVIIVTAVPSRPGVLLLRLLLLRNNPAIVVCWINTSTKIPTTTRMVVTIVVIIVITAIRPIIANTVVVSIRGQN